MQSALREQLEASLGEIPDTLEIEAKLYSGSVTIQRGDFGSKKHAYYWVEGGYYVPGATSILQVLNKPALIQWAANETAKHVLANLKEGATQADIERVCDEATKKHVRIKEDAGQVGTNVHELAHKLFNGKPIAVPEDKATKNGLVALQDWIGANDVRPIETERVAFSKSAFFAGTFDLLASVNGKLSLVDLKTSTGVYDDHKIQLGGYRFAWEEEHEGEKIEQLIILHLSKKTGKMRPYEWDTRPAMQYFTDTFLRVKAVNDNLKKMGDY